MRGMQIRKPMAFRLPQELIEKVDAYRRQQPHTPTRTQVIEDALRNLIEKPKKRAVESIYENPIDRPTNPC